MKPIAVINVEKLAAIDSDPEANLQKEGYVVIFAHDGPAITLHRAAPDRRERIATAVLAGLVSNGGTASSTMCEASVRLADLLIKELDK